MLSDVCNFPVIFRFLLRPGFAAMLIASTISKLSSLRSAGGVGRGGRGRTLLSFLVVSRAGWTRVKSGEAGGNGEYFSVGHHGYKRCLPVCDLLGR